eukprot:Sspe_Gene.47428::Locus_24162_Transcript_1_1_Confidence_1.000_Length_2181::g.47428::m.47428
MKGAMRAMLLGVAIPLAVFITGVVLTLVLLEKDKVKEDQGRQEYAVAKGQEAVQGIREAISDSLNTAWALAGYVAGQGRVPINHEGTKEDRMVLLDNERFQNFASRLKERFPSVGSFQLQPSAVLTQAHPPLTPGVLPHGHDLLYDTNRRADILAGIELQSMLVAGPFPLVQGGVALLSRYPVFIWPSGMDLRTLTVNESMQYWWGMTASLVLVDTLLHKQVKITDILPQGDVDYVLEYWNDNTQSVVIVSNQTMLLDAPSVNAKGVLRKKLVDNSFALLEVALPGGRRWNLWVRKHKMAELHAGSIALGVVTSLAAALVIASVFWLPLIARQNLYRVLYDVFEGVGVMEIDNPDEVESRMPTDSPDYFTNSLKRMLNNLIIYRRFLPESVKVDTEEESVADSQSQTISQSARTHSCSSGYTTSTGLSSRLSSVRKIRAHRVITGFNQTKCTVVHFECREGRVLGNEVQEAEKKHTQFLSTVHSHVSERRGTIFAVGGGWCAAEFNCIQRVAMHAMHGTSTALTVWNNDGTIRSGVYSCNSYSGNVGTDALMGFTIASPAPERAALLAYHAHTLPEGGTVVGRSVYEAAKLHIQHVAADVVVFPGGVTEIVYAALAQKKSCGQEWMYDLEEGSQNTEYDMAWEMLGSDGTIQRRWKVETVWSRRLMSHIGPLLAGKNQGYTVDMDLTRPRQSN